MADRRIRRRTHRPRSSAAPERISGRSGRSSADSINVFRKDNETPYHMSVAADARVVGLGAALRVVAVSLSLTREPSLLDVVSIGRGSGGGRWALSRTGWDRSTADRHSLLVVAQTTLLVVPETLGACLYLRLVAEALGVESGRSSFPRKKERKVSLRAGRQGVDSIGSVGAVERRSCQIRSWDDSRWFVGTRTGHRTRRRGHGGVVLRGSLKQQFSSECIFKFTLW